MLQQIVDDYLGIFPEDRAKLRLFLRQLRNGDEMNNRKTLPGHATGSAIVLSPDKTKVLLIYHKFFQGWFQPGGHWDPGEPDPLSAARRETEEETSVSIAKQIIPYGDKHIPLNINTHPIPARPEKGEEPHAHHDFIYVFLAASEELAHQEAEVEAARWFAFDAPETEHIRSLIAKLKAADIL